MVVRQQRCSPLRAFRTTIYVSTRIPKAHPHTCWVAWLGADNRLRKVSTLLYSPLRFVLLHLSQRYLLCLRHFCHRCLQSLGPFEAPTARLPPFSVSSRISRPPTLLSPIPTRVCSPPFCPIHFLSQLTTPSLFASLGFFTPTNFVFLGFSGVSAA